MGADIHSVAQVQWSKGGPWEDVTDALWVAPQYHFDPKKPVSFHNVPYLSQPFEGRLYWAFGALAGVRDPNTELIHPLRGIPEGLTHYGSKDWPVDSEDLHSHSWATLEELANYADRTPSEAVAEYIWDAINPLRSLHDRGIPVRFVYAFDN